MFFSIVLITIGMLNAILQLQYSEVLGAPERSFATKADVFDVLIEDTRSTMSSSLRPGRRLLSSIKVQLNPFLSYLAEKLQVLSSSDVPCGHGVQRRRIVRIRARMSFRAQTSRRLPSRIVTFAFCVCTPIRHTAPNTITTNPHT